MSQEITVNDQHLSEYYASLVPFGSLDVIAAIRSAIDAGKSAEWAAEQVQEYADSCGVKLSECDPVAAVYDSLFQEFRNELDTETGWDICNDSAASTPIYVAGNCLATTFDYSEDAITELKEKLAAENVEIGMLSESSQWVLAELGITQDDLKG